MKERIVAVLGMVSLLTTVGCANMMGQDKKQGGNGKSARSPAEMAPAPKIADSETITVTATVRAVDLKNRTVTLKAERRPALYRSCRRRGAQSAPGSSG